MSGDVDPAEVYRGVAVRLRMMAESNTDGSVRDGLLGMASHYDVMAAQAEDISHHTFGRPFGRRAGQHLS